MTQHKDRVRDAFTQQADRYASSAIIAAEKARRRFVDFVAPHPTDRVLDVATGPGFLALLFAERAANVVGIDLTPAMLARAESNRAARGLANVRFQAGDAEALPFPEPARVLAEMVRVTRPARRVALLAITTSENPAQAQLHNQFEGWRDLSHMRCLPLGELVALFEDAQLRDVRTATDETARELDEWFAISHTSAEVAARVRAAFIASIPDDATGLRVHRDGERVCFTHTFAWVVGMK